jgi:hypothetical protein
LNNWSTLCVIDRTTVNSSLGQGESEEGTREKSIPDGAPMLHVDCPAVRCAVCQETEEIQVGRKIKPTSRREMIEQPREEDRGKA